MTLSTFDLTSSAADCVPTQSAAVIVPTTRRAEMPDPQRDWELRATSAVVDLMGRIASAATLRLACQDLVEAVAQHLGCQQAAVALRASRALRD